MTTPTPHDSTETANTTGASRKKTIHLSAEQAAAIGRSYRAGRLTCLICYGLLLAIFSYLFLLDTKAQWGAWLIACLPLLIFIPGLIKNTHRTYSWLCFVILMYFLVYVPLAMTRSSFSDWLIIAITCVFFLAAMMTSRWLQYWNYYHNVQTQQPAVIGNDKESS